VSFEHLTNKYLKIGDVARWLLYGLNGDEGLLTEANLDIFFSAIDNDKMIAIPLKSYSAEEIKEW
jgi:hypothetical protein